MLRLNLEHGRRVLVLGAHADDIEIGCGGTILRLIDEGLVTDVTWIVFSGAGPRTDEARASANAYLTGAGSRVEVHDFEDGFLPYNGTQVKRVFESLKREVAPDLILTHRRDDAHQDHRLVAELTWNTFRDHLILEYEIPKYDGDLGNPNLFVPLSVQTGERKIKLLLEGFPSQRSRRWFSEDTFWSMLRLRGVESNAPSGFAEGFHCRKLVI